MSAGGAQRSGKGTALGVFGVGKVGAAVTKFAASFIMVAYGWQAVAEVWALALVAMAIVFWIFAKDAPVFADRKRTGAPPPSATQHYSVLMKLQVWRFSLYTNRFAKLPLLFRVRSGRGSRRKSLI